MKTDFFIYIEYPNSKHLDSLLLNSIKEKNKRTNQSTQLSILIFAINHHPFSFLMNTLTGYKKKREEEAKRMCNFKEKNENVM